MDLQALVSCYRILDPNETSCITESATADASFKETASPSCITESASAGAIDDNISFHEILFKVHGITYDQYLKNEEELNNKIQ